MSRARTFDDSNNAKLSLCAALCTKTSSHCVPKWSGEPLNPVQVVRLTVRPRGNRRMLTLWLLAWSDVFTEHLSVFAESDVDAA